MSPTTAFAAVGVIGWGVYLGGAVAMELIWRPVQEEIPPSQVNVVCGRMGRRYRWIALTALVVVAASAAAELVASDAVSWSTLGAHFSPASRHGRTLLLTVTGWSVLLVILVLLTVWAHPALHVRMEPDMSRRERERARARLRRAIRRMDRLLRADLAVAFATVLCAASLPWGGLL